MSFTSPTTRRDLWIAVGSRSLSLLGDEAAVVALALRFVDRGAGTWSISALLIAGLAPLVACAPFAGRLADAVDSRLLLVVTGLVQALLCSGLVFASNTALTLVLVAALGAGAAVTGATWLALLPAIAGPEGLASALGLSQSAATVATISAPVVGGVLTGRLGAGAPLAVDAATFLALAAAAAVVRTRRVPHREPDDKHGGLRLIRADTVLSLLVPLLGMFAVLGAMVNVIEVFLVRDTLQSTSTWYGIVGGLWGAGMFTGSMLGRRAKGELALGRLLVSSAPLLGASIAAYALAPSVGWLVPAALVGGTMNGLLNLASMSLVMGRSPEHARGRIAAAVSGVASTAFICAYLLGGVLAVALTPREIFAVAGLAGLAAPAVCGRRLLRAVQAPSHSPNASKEYGRPRKSATSSAASALPPRART